MKGYASPVRLLGMVGFLIACAVPQVQAENILYIQPYLQNVARNGIILISHVSDLRIKEGMPLREAILKGAEERISPVLMTALSTSLGMIPLALTSGSGAEIQRPLAVVVLGGMITSAILTLLVLPAIYQMIEGRSEAAAVKKNEDSS